MTPARADIEALLKTRKLDGTLLESGGAAVEVRTGETGHAWLDPLLGGGWPRGETSEIVGPASAGRTSVLGASLAAATRRGELAALVDTADVFDPLTAAAAGVDLDRLLWARGSGVDARGLDRAIKAFGLALDAGAFGLVALDLGDVSTRQLGALPFTTWRRLQRLVEHRDTIALVLAPVPLARSARGLTMQLAADAATPVWHGRSARARHLIGLALRPQVQSARPLTRVCRLPSAVCGPEEAAVYRRG